LAAGPRFRVSSQPPEEAWALEPKPLRLTGLPEACESVAPDPEVKLDPEPARAICVTPPRPA
jgi:hypothetical protein